MYCPKCKQTFEEGSRRFCPTDGARLVSDTIPQTKGGVFAGLIPQMEGISDLGGRSAARTDVTAEMGLEDKVETDDELYFELDDEPVGTPMNESAFAEAARTFEPIPREERSTIAARPSPRKVNPYEISDGGVNLKEERPEIFTGDFDVSNPESLVGKPVKGRYQVVEFLGGDENGLAYLGQDRIGNRKVLVRILLHEASDETLASILAEERVSLSHLTHPNIARLIDSGTFTNGIQFLVSAYYDGLSVRDILEIYGKFPADRAGRTIRQAASALGQAHQQGILHRDVRPENLIIDSESDTEQLFLVNFGASNGEATEMNAVYKAPEVLDGRSGTAASDVYSLAVVAYEMLTGRLPFGGESTREILRSQYAGLSLRPTDIDPELPPQVDQVFEDALAFKSSERYSRAREFGDAFYEAVTGGDDAQTIKPRPAVRTAGPASSFPVYRHRAAAAAAAEAGNPATSDEPLWRQRSSDPLQLADTSKRNRWLATIAILLAVIGIGWWYITRPIDPATQSTLTPPPESNEAPVNTIVPAVEMPPMPRNVPQPANTIYFENTKHNLKGDLLDNFAGFSLYYPKDWKANGLQPGIPGQSRGKFLDISRSTPDGRIIEQMSVGYYPSKGTYAEDLPAFPELVAQTDETLRKLLPGYMRVSEAQIKVNGEWPAYELKFQAGGASADGGTLTVWGRRIFLPAARPGTHVGFEITLIATSLGGEVKSVDDVGVKGQLAPILYSFEPSQNF